MRVTVWIEIIRYVTKILMYPQPPCPVLPRCKRLNRLEVRKRLIVRPDRQNAHVRRTGLQVCVNTVADFRFAPPRDDVIPQPVATPFLKLGIPLPEGFSGVRIVLQSRNVGLHVLPRHRTRLGRVTFKDHCLCSANPRLRADLRADFRGVFWRHKICMCSLSFRGR